MRFKFVFHSSYIYVDTCIVRKFSSHFRKIGIHYDYVLRGYCSAAATAEFIHIIEEKEPFLGFVEADTLEAIRGTSHKCIARAGYKI